MLVALIQLCAQLLPGGTSWQCWPPVVLLSSSNCDLLRNIRGCLRWCFLRNVHLATLHVRSSTFFDAVQLSAILQRSSQSLKRVFCTNAEMLSILSNINGVYSGLERLSICEFGTHDDYRTMMSKVAGSVIELQLLDRVTTTDTRCFFEICCPSVTSLTLKTNLSPCNVIGFEKCFPNLEELIVTRGTSAIPSLGPLFGNFAHLRKVIFDQVEGITDVMVMEVARNCPQLRCIDLRACEQLTETSILAVCEHCPLLEELNMSAYFYFISVAAATCIGERLGSTLKKLWLRECNFERGALTALRHCITLQFLDLSFILPMTSEELGELVVSCTALHTLLVDGMMLSDDTLDSIARRCPVLCCLPIAGCSEYSSDGVLNLLDNAHSLTSLVVSTEDTMFNGLSTSLLKRQFPRLAIEYQEFQ